LYVTITISVSITIQYSVAVSVTGVNSYKNLFKIRLILILNLK